MGSSNWPPYWPVCSAGGRAVSQLDLSDGIPSTSLITPRTTSTPLPISFHLSSIPSSGLLSFNFNLAPAHLLPHQRWPPSITTSQHLSSHFDPNFETSPTFPGFVDDCHGATWVIFLEEPQWQSCAVLTARSDASTSRIKWFRGLPVRAIKTLFSYNANVIKQNGSQILLLIMQCSKIFVCSRHKTYKRDFLTC